MSRGLVRRHWRAFATFAAAGGLAVIGAVVVFLWFVGNAQSSGLLPRTVDLWTMGDLVSFIVNSAFWEVLLVGVPSGLAAAAAWGWWRRLPEDERRELSYGRSSRSKGGGGATVLLFVAFCIKVYLDGKWGVAVSSFSVDYIVSSLVLILVWTVVLFGVPATVALVWWLRKETG